MFHLRFRILPVLWIVLFSACTTNKEEFSDVIQLEDSKAALKLIEFQQNTYILTYNFENQEHKLEWFLCQPKPLDQNQNQIFLLVNREEAGFNEESFCNGWIAQSFLVKGYSVVGVNRPGFGKSTGKSDLGGKLSQAAMDALLKQEAKRPFYGIWGVEEASILASFIARRHQLFSALIIGNGIFDAELTHKETQNAQLKEKLDRLVEKEEDMAYEIRSIAWDFGGLPKKIYLYHVESNQKAPISQAKEFRDSLATTEHQVELFIIQPKPQDSMERIHVSLLDRILDTLK